MFDLSAECNDSFGCVIRRRVLVFWCVAWFAGPSADLVPDISWFLSWSLGVFELSLESNESVGVVCFDVEFECFVRLLRFG
jgi:hypothetical protein